MSSELTELADKLDDAEGSYNLVRRVAVEVASALRTLSSQEKQEPVAWQQLINEKWCNLPEDWSEAECLKIPPGKTFRGLYTAPQKPQPAPGWDEAIDACKAIAKQHVEDIVKNSLAGEWVAQGIFDAIEALSHQPAPVERDPLDDLVARFSNALLKKLKLAQANGRSGWEKDDWEVDCQRGLLRHVEKGDPRDVAAYCAFMWHHGWITARPAPVAANASAEARLRELLLGVLYQFRKKGCECTFPSENCCDYAKAKSFLSAHPHASDCARDDCGAYRCRDLGCFGVCKPSDRTADVTEERHPIETLWREVGLPEYFLGNAGTNHKLYALYDAIRSFDAFTVGRR